jgi:hypothetical protein
LKELSVEVLAHAEAPSASNGAQSNSRVRLIGTEITVRKAI